MKVDVSVISDGKWVDLTIKELDRKDSPTERDLVMYSDVSGNILFHIDEDGLLTVEFIDIHENEHIIPICYAEGLFGG